jgi:hypothetical protein
MSDDPVLTEGELTNLRDRDHQFRSESRYKSPLAAIAYVHTDDQPDRRQTVWLANISHHGIGFLSKSSIDVGIRLRIEMIALAASKREIVAEVMHATLQVNGDWIIGCRLDMPLRQDELEVCLTFDSPFLSSLEKS